MFGHHPTIIIQLDMRASAVPSAALIPSITFRSTRYPQFTASRYPSFRSTRYPQFRAGEGKK